MDQRSDEFVSFLDGDFPAKHTAEVPVAGNTDHPSHYD
jgi:hypothetical protein